jgi:hypothetical protein
MGYGRIMSRKLLPLVILAAVALPVGPAWASGDFACTVAWKLQQSDYAGCNNLPFLSPGNDSRVNLQLLLLDSGRARIELPAQMDAAMKAGAPDRAGDASPFTVAAFSALIPAPGEAPPGPALANGDTGAGLASGEGSRCRSNAAGVGEFKAALGRQLRPAPRRAHGPGPGAPGPGPHLCKGSAAGRPPGRRHENRNQFTSGPRPG